MLRDNVVGFELPDNFLTGYGNELNALRTLRIGLEYLARQVAHAESTLAAPEGGKPAVGFSWGNSPDLAALPGELLVCAFHWYAVSSCNLVRLIGWLRVEHDATAPKPQDYVRAVLPDVLPWRKKVAAHFAQSDDHDRRAERMVSVMHPLARRDDRLIVQPFTLRIKRGNAPPSTSERLVPWSLTEVHEGLSARYKTVPGAQPPVESPP